MPWATSTDVRWLQLAALLLMVGCTGGGGTPEAARWQVAERLIAEEPSGFFDRAALYDEVEVFAWRFETAEDIAAWRWSQTPEPVAGGVRLRADAEPASLTRQIDLAALDVDALELELAGLERGPLRVRWASGDPGSSTGFDGRATVAGRGGEGKRMLRHRLALADVADWSGRIAQLRIDTADETLELRAVRGLRYRLPDGFLDAAVQLGWKVDLDHEVRHAWLAPPGHSRRHRLELPPQARLRLAYGVVGRASQPVSLRVSVKREGQPAEMVFEAAAEASGLETEGLESWRQAEIDLSAYAGENVELVFQTVADGWSASAGLPVWGSPEVLAPAVNRSRDPVASPNVILISVDTLRADRLGVYGYPQPTSPRIDAWARERAVTFRRAVTTAPWTLPAHVSMLTGLDALSHGVNFERGAPTELQLLPEILRQRGYGTYGVTGGGWLDTAKGLAQGFDVYRYWAAEARKLEVEAGMERALEIVSAAPGPFFLFFHTYEVHDPYRPRRPYADRCPPSQEAEGEQLYSAVKSKRDPAAAFGASYQLRRWRAGTPMNRSVRAGAGELPRVSCLYDSGIAFVDAQLGRLFDRLRELDLEGETLVVLTSDHGESLGEDGYFKHAYLFDSNLLVPLIIAFPDGRQAGATVDAQVSIVDIVPTILGELGIAAAGVDGAALQPLVAGEVERAPHEAWSYAGHTNYGVSLRVDDRLKYVFNNTAWPSESPRGQLFDLRSPAGEQRDLAEQSRQQASALQARVAAELREHASGVRLQLANVACGALTGEASGAPIQVNRVKTEQPEASAIEWLGRRRASFELAAGESVSLLLEAVSGELTLAGEAVSCPGGRSLPFRATVDVETLDQPWLLELTGPASGPASAEPVARLQASLEGSRSSAPSETEVDPRLLDQLRALGYVE
ncbi:MAG: sulfatase-like hydrolase/transferase [Acidobacteriota bacterium]